MKVAFFSPKRNYKATHELALRMGFEPVHVPMVEIIEKEVEDVRDADFTVVTSKTAAKISLSRNLLRGKVVAIGEKTAEILKDFEPLTPSKYDSRTLFEEFKDVFRGKVVNLLRSDKGDKVLLKLSEVCDLREYVLYEIKPIIGKEQALIVEKLANREIDAVIFSSRLIVRSFFENARAVNLLDEVVSALNDMVTVALGKPTEEELRKFGVAAITPEKYTFEEALKLIGKLKYS